MPILYTIGRMQIAGVVFGAVTWCGVFSCLLAAIREARVGKLEGRSSKGGRRLPKTLTLSEGGIERGERRSERKQGLSSNVNGERQRSLRGGVSTSHGSRRGTKREGSPKVHREWRAGAQVPFAYVKGTEMTHQKSQYAKVIVHQMSAFG